MKLVLFDIDGTILWTDGAGRRALGAALHAVFGASGPPDHRFDGKTDPQIVREMMRAAGFSGAEIEERLPPLLRHYLEELERELRTEASAVHLFGGVTELLDALEKRDDLLLGLLTGNLREGAELKLRAAGVDFGRFRVGAFGCDHADRPELPAIALRRACELLGADLSGRSVVVIGDTPADVLCGRGIGARAIAVATGRYPLDELRAHAPFAAFATLADTQRVMEAILAPEARGAE